MPRNNQVRIIPLNKIESGIIECLRNSIRILKAATSIFEDKQDLGGGGAIIENSPEYAVVMYYYALEELGKAIKLEKAKKQAEESGKNEIDVGSWFLDHNLKLDEAITEIGNDFHIRKTELIPEDCKVFQVEFIEPVITNFQERSKLLLTDFNESSGKWGVYLEMFLSEELEIKIPKLKKILQAWRSRYH